MLSYENTTSEPCRLPILRFTLLLWEILITLKTVLPKFYKNLELPIGEISHWPNSQMSNSLQRNTLPPLGTVRPCIPVSHQPVIYRYMPTIITVKIWTDKYNYNISAKDADLRSTPPVFYSLPHCQCHMR